MLSFLTIRSPLPPIGVDPLAFGQDPDEVGVHHLDGRRRVAHTPEGHSPVVADVLLHDIPTSGVLKKFKNYKIIV